MYHGKDFFVVPYFGALFILRRQKDSTMTSQVAASQLLYIPAAHLEQLSRGVSSLTVDPFKNALYYFFPFIGAFFTNYQELRNDPAQEAMMPQSQAALVLKEIEDLTKHAGIPEIIPYMALNHEFSSCGGSYSLTSPALFIPDQHLFRRNGHSLFGQEKPDEKLQNNPWIFSDDETRFLIARELGQIKENSALLRLAIKVTVLTTLVAIYASPFGWPLSLCLFIGVIGMHIISERLFQARADLVGVEILGKKIKNPTQIAIATLEKIRQQNLYRRENSRIAKLYITASGDNLLDFVHPYLTARIERLTNSLHKPF